MRTKKVAKLARWLIVGAVLIGMPIIWATFASAETIIAVTTTTDEDSAPGVGAGCSLYEAGRAITTGAAYGGCEAPGPNHNVIQLPAGTYNQTLALELDVSTAPAAAGLIIIGAGSDQTTIDTSGLTTDQWISALDLTADNVTVKNLKLTGGNNIFINGNSATLTDVIVDQAKYNDLYIIGDDATLIDVSLSMNNPDYNGQNIEIDGDRATLNNITVDASNNVNEAYGPGVSVTGDYASLSNLSINDVIGDGIDLYGSFGSVDNAIITNSGHDGIGVYGNSAQLSNIHITNSGTSSSTGSSIGIYGDDSMASNGGNTLLEHIFADTSAGDGIGLYDDSTSAGRLRPILNDVHVHGTGDGYDGIGIYSSGAQLTDIVVEQTGGYGIYMYQDDIADQPVSLTNVLTDQTGESGLNISIKNNNLTLDHISILSANSVQQSWQSSIYISAYGDSPLVITNSHIAGNQAAGGLSLYGDCTEKTITDTYIADNNSSHGSSVYGGGISNGCGNMTLNRVTIANNYATIGGGIYTMEDFNNTDPAAFTKMTNVTVFNNQAQSIGGGIYVWDSSDGTVTEPNQDYRWNNVTIAGNQAPQGASLYIDRSNETGPSPIISNTILAAATEQQCASNHALTALPDGSSGNLSTDGSCFNIDNIVGDAGLADSLSAFNTAAQIGHDNEGGHLPVLMLLADSPAVNSADKATCEAIDERNVSRPDGNGCDVGAYELTSTPPINTSNDTNSDVVVPGVPNTGFSLESASLGWAVSLISVAGIYLFMATRVDHTKRRH
jgi:parallel beta-helix repeat protein